jgi:FixJ family two-component response regulator
VALNSHLQVAQGIRAALATRTAALSGSQTKAPGSAGGYLLTDVVMPGLSGRELSEMLGSLYPDLKTIFMSGYTDDAVLRHGIHAPGTTFLQKPFAMGTLARKVRNTLGQTETVQ